MSEGAFYQPKRTNPTALAIVVLMHGAALTALALAKGEVIVEAIANTKVFNVEEKQPPPPEPVKPVEKAVTPPETVITHVPPVIKTPAEPDLVVLKPLPPVQEIVIEPPREVIVPKAEPAVAPPPKKVAPARAKANLASYVSDADYPSSAIRNEEAGTTRFRLVVGTDGKVTQCTVTGSSGSSALDSTTCRLMKQRAKFTPARDSDGRLVSDSVSNAIRWVLPD